MRLFSLLFGKGEDEKFKSNEEKSFIARRCYASHELLKGIHADHSLPRYFPSAAMRSCLLGVTVRQPRDVVCNLSRLTSHYITEVHAFFFAREIDSLSTLAGKQLQRRVSTIVIFRMSRFLRRVPAACGCGVTGSLCCSDHFIQSLYL